MTSLSRAAELLPTTETIEPASSVELAAAVRDCYSRDVAVYPIGGGTSLDFGLTPKKSGIGLALSQFHHVIDYPARDLTITIESGMTMKSLAGVLAQERQRLPVDVPNALQATIGGVVATNFNGPRRYGLGTIRDYVIGIHAVDGRGMGFKGGGRVVKNVAGYDFCKLLTGSLGTLGIITQLTLKLKPIPERAAFLVCPIATGDDAEKLLAALVHSATTPVAVELLAGPSWSDDPALVAAGVSAYPSAFFLAVGFEGTDAEVRWMTQQLGREWWDLGVGTHQTLFDSDATDLLDRLTEFPASPGAPMVLKASIVPSGVTAFLATAREFDPRCSVQAHAGNGIVLVRLSQTPMKGITKGIIGKMQSAAAACGGTLVILSSSAGMEATQQSVWGRLSSPQPVMTSVKREFDPRNILNPDRFAYSRYPSS